MHASTSTVAGAHLRGGVDGAVPLPGGQGHGGAVAQRLDEAVQEGGARLVVDGVARAAEAAEDLRRPLVLGHGAGVVLGLQKSSGSCRVRGGHIDRVTAGGCVVTCSACNKMMQLRHVTAVCGVAAAQQCSCMRIRCSAGEQPAQQQQQHPRPPSSTCSRVGGPAGAFRLRRRRSSSASRVVRPQLSAPDTVWTVIS